MIKFYIQCDSNYNPIFLETIHAPLWWQLRGLRQTTTGYGSKLVTEYKIKHGTRLKRVYYCIFSNIGYYYIISNKKKIFVDAQVVD